MKFLTKFYRWMRLIHIYVSTTLCCLLIMFCVSGILLNHSHWLEDDYSEHRQQWKLPPSLVAGLQIKHKQDWQPPLDQLQAFIKQQKNNLGTPEKIDLDVDAQEIIFDFQLPAAYATVVVNTQGEMSMQYRRAGVLSIINDLHKGKHSGNFWSWLIDISAGLMLLFALSGLLILIQNKKRRRLGFIFAVLGTLSPVLIYFIFVPRI